MTHRTLVLLLALVAIPRPAESQRSFTPAELGEDFDSLWAFAQHSYAYFEPGLQDWSSVPARYRARAVEAKSLGEFVGVLEEVMEELRDSHAHLGTNTASSPNLVPTGADLWAELIDDRAVITQVRTGSAADSAGLRAGMEIRAVDGLAIDQAIVRQLGAAVGSTPLAAREWALRALLAGRRDRRRSLAVGADGSAREFELPPARPIERPGLLEAKVLPGNLGYVRLFNSLGDEGLIAAWDAALRELQDTDGLILDLRDTPSGGNTAVARGLMGRLVVSEVPYQLHRMPYPDAEPDVRRSWLEMVSPRGPFSYSRPVILLVDHWTGSMGEGVAVGLDGMRRATVVGTRMAGLQGATYSATLPHTGFSVTVPAERLFQVNGQPREAFVPPVLVDLARSDPARSDVILERGIAVLRRQIAGR